MPTALFLILLFLAAILTAAVFSKLKLIQSEKMDIIGGRTKIFKKGKTSKFEEYVRQIFEKVLSNNNGNGTCKFPTAHPKWLKFTPNKNLKDIRGSAGMELDGYCEKIGIAFEAQGPLHSKFIPEEEDYKSYFRRILMDREKVALCKERGILLIQIDYRLSRHLIEPYIRSRIYDFIQEKMKSGEKRPPFLTLEIIDKFSRKPDNYVPPDDVSAQKFGIWRNEQLENELGLAL